MLKTKIFLCGLLVALTMCFALQSADALTVGELLAEMPAKDSTHAAQLYEQIAAGNETLIAALCDSVMLWQAGADPKVPMALHGLASHVMRPEYGANRGKIARILEAALGRAGDVEVQRFFMSLIRVCGDADSVSVLAPWLCKEALFEDALYTLECIGGESVIALLQNLDCADMPEHFQLAVDMALTRMRGRTDDEAVPAAAASRTAFADSNLKPHERAAALRALVQGQGADALPDLIEAARNPEPIIWGMALQLAATMPGDDVSKAWVQKLPEFSGLVRPQVIFMLGHRDDAAARDAVRDALSDDDVEVRLAACSVIGCYGDTRALAALENAMSKAGSNAEIQAVKNALLQFPEPEVSRLAAKQIGRGDKAQRVAYLEIIASRRAEDQLKSVRQCLTNKEAQVRRAAVNTLAAIGEHEDLATLFAIVLSEAESAEVNASRTAIITIADRHGLRQEVLKQVGDRFHGAPLDARTRLLKTLDALGDAEALEEARKITEGALFGDLQDMQEASLQTLGTWRDVRATEMLLGFFERLENEDVRMNVLQQILISVPRTLTEAPQQLAMLEKVTAVCRTEAETQAVTEALAKVKPAE